MVDSPANQFFADADATSVEATRRIEDSVKRIFSQSEDGLKVPEGVC